MVSAFVQISLELGTVTSPTTATFSLHQTCGGWSHASIVKVQYLGVLETLSNELYRTYKNSLAQKIPPGRFYNEFKAFLRENTLQFKKDPFNPATAPLANLSNEHQVALVFKMCLDIGFAARFPGVGSENESNKVHIAYSLLTPAMLARIHAGRIAKDNATPNRPTCLVVSHEAAERSILAEIDQLMAVNEQGAGLKKLAQGRFDDSRGQMRKPSALDPTGAWNFVKGPGRIPSLMNVQTYHRPQPMGSILP